jgi:hypothetical protein
MEIRIVIQTTEPLAGIAPARGREPMRFEGWLELLRVLSTLVRPEGLDPPTSSSVRPRSVAGASNTRRRGVERR